MNENFKIVGVHYVADDYNAQWDNDIYYYKITTNIDINVGDRVYIKNTLKENLAEVVEYFEPNDAEFSSVLDTNRVVVPKRFLKIDLTEILEAEAEMEKLHNLENLMDKKLKEVEKIQKYQLLKEVDPEFSKIYDEFMELRAKISSKNVLELNAPEDK